MVVDSKEKTTGDKNKDKAAAKKVEYWPLIKVVRLRVKAAPLSTGAVIVDLLGVHDSNAARSAIAEEYIKRCNGLWIVAPITRAVDDKAAKSLLSRSFKRQLKMDGGFNMVTFIYSKTDNISLMECQESLNLSMMSDLWIKSEEFTNKKQKTKQRVKDLKEQKRIYTTTIDEIEEELEIWDSLKDGRDKRKMIITHEQSDSSKRKRGHNALSPWKKSCHADSNIEGSSTDYGGDQTEGSNELEAIEDESGREYLTKNQIAEKILELKNLKKDFCNHKQELDAQINDVQNQMSELEAAEDKIQEEMNAIAIVIRNEYSRGAIRQDFATGIKELDQELAEGQDLANFNPDIEICRLEHIKSSKGV